MNKLMRDEKGQALMIVLVLMLLGGLIIAPMLAYMGSGIKIGKEVYEERMELFYAADSGIEDGLWKIKYDELDDLIPEYNEYNYSDPSDPEYYYYPDYPNSLLINEKDVGVIVENIWIPKDIAKPEADDAKDIIEGVEGELPKLVIAGGIPATSTYQIKITYNYDNDLDPGGAGLLVDKIGIWLPPGFEYDYDYNYGADEDSLAYDPDTAPYSEPDDEDYCSGKAVEWDFEGSVPLVDFPGAGGSSESIERSFTFHFTSDQPEQSPEVALSWIDNVDAYGIEYAWDANSRVYKITSTAKDEAFDPPKETEVVAYTARSKMREIGKAISGDYVAVGNTLMTSTGSQFYRNILYKDSYATIEGFTGPGDVPPGYIPVGATVDAAYLYWSGWIENMDIINEWEDPCSEDPGLDNWVPGDHWTLYPSPPTPVDEFRGQGGGTDNDRTLELKNSLDLPDDYGYEAGKMVKVYWEQREEGTLEDDDILYFAFSGDGGNTWSQYFEAFHGNNPPGAFGYFVPAEYITDDFKMLFLVSFDSTSEYVYIDNIRISVVEQPVENARVNEVEFNGEKITAELGDCQIVTTSDAYTMSGTGGKDSWCYSCRYDATDLVDDLIEAIADPTDSVTFTLGHANLDAGGYYRLSNYPSGTNDGRTDYPLATPASSPQIQYMYTYAGWSLIVVYSSPETKGHQLYLFDDLRYLAPHTEGLKFPISGFLVPERVQNPDGTWEENAAHITCFVGDGDAYFSGDFIALNAPEGLTGPEIPNTYKLYDGIQLSNGPYWPFMPNNAGSPNNVWNSQSPGLMANGVDIDTFNITWESGLIEPDDTSAEVVLNYASTEPPSGIGGAELINFIYIIISFRSEVTYGGTISYLVKG